MKGKIVYIAGLGRSGSTLLESLLALREGIAVIGEFRSLWGKYFDERQLCSCTLQMSECPFWSPILGADSRLHEVLATLREQRFQVGRYRNIPELMKGTARSSELRSYVEGVERLYDALFEGAGAQVIVDSSKDIPHAFVLSTFENYDVRIIHLVRDPRAVAYSWTKPKKKPEVHWKEELMPIFKPAHTAAKWLRSNIAGQWLSKTSSPYMRVRYEDFVVDPELWITKIFEFIDEPDNIGDETQNLVHSASGNPMRFSDTPLKISPDARWVTEMRPGDKSAVTALTLPILMKYGYSISGARNG